MNKGWRSTIRLLRRVQKRWSDSGKLLVQLVQSDRETARLWIVQIPSVDAAIGKTDRHWCTEQLLQVAPINPRMAQSLVHSLPKSLARLSEEQRRRYRIILPKVGFEQIDFLPDLSEALVDLLSEFEDAELLRFVLQAQALFERNPHQGRQFLKRSSQKSQAAVEALHAGVALSSLKEMLTFYAHAHCQRTVFIRSGGQSSFIDGKHVYLPDRMNLGQGASVDRLAYRVLTARNVGYLEFGTLDLSLAEVDGPWLSSRPEELPLERCFRSFPNTQLAKDLFLILENRRIEHRLRSQYPGVARAMAQLGEAWRPERPNPPQMQPVEELIEALYLLSIGEAPHRFRSTAAERVFHELQSEILRPLTDVNDSVRSTLVCFERAYGLMRKSATQVETDYRALELERTRGGVSLDLMSDSERQKELLVHETLAALKEADAQATVAQAREAAEDYFSQAEFLEHLEAPSGVLREAEEEDSEGDRLEKSSLLEGVVHIGAGILYPEWDMRIEDMKPNWTQVFECQMAAGDLAFVTQTKLEFGMEIQKLRRIFEGLRPEQVQRFYGLEDGDDIDVARVIEAKMDRRMGLMPSTHLYSATRRAERDTAVAFLVDMSSSTNELASDNSKRILEVEKEALIVLAEAIDALGDAFAIYGYSGFGRSQVAFYMAKNFDEAWDDTAQARVGQLRWMMENRDGAAIRHCATKLTQRPEKHRLMILLSDGKPLDCGCPDYSDAYAQADTHAAILEARQQGVHVFCITVDPYGQKYLRELYGEGGYTVIEQVTSLPERLPAIYRRLTS